MVLDHAHIIAAAPEAAGVLGGVHVQLGGDVPQAAGESAGLGSAPGINFFALQRDESACTS